MKREIRFIIQRKKDGLFFHQHGNIEGTYEFASSFKVAWEFDTREQAQAQIKKMQNWLKRPKFGLIQVERYSPQGG